MTNQPDATNNQRGAPRGAPRRVDLTGRERHLRGAMDAASRVASRFCQAARQRFSFLVKRHGHIRAGSVALHAVAGDELLEGPTYQVLLNTNGTGWAAVWIGSAALVAIVEGTLGAREGGTRGGLGTELTAAQRAVVRKIAVGLGTDLASAIMAEMSLTYQVSGSESLAQGSVYTPPGSDGLMIDCVLDGDDSNPSLRILLSAEALAAALKERDQEEETQADPRMAEALQEIPVGIVAELGKVTLGLRRLLSLRVGQVLRLESALDEPVSICVGGLKKFTGVPVISRGQMAIEIRGRHGT